MQEWVCYAYLNTFDEISPCPWIWVFVHVQGIVIAKPTDTHTDITAQKTYLLIRVHECTTRHIAGVHSNSTLLTRQIFFLGQRVHGALVVKTSENDNNPQTIPSKFPRPFCTDFYFVIVWFMQHDSIAYLHACVMHNTKEIVKTRHWRKLIEICVGRNMYRIQHLMQTQDIKPRVSSKGLIKRTQA